MGSIGSIFSADTSLFALLWPCALAFKSSYLLYRFLQRHACWSYPHVYSPDCLANTLKFPYKCVKFRTASYLKIRFWRKPSPVSEAPTTTIWRLIILFPISVIRGVAKKSENGVVRSKAASKTSYRKILCLDHRAIETGSKTDHRELTVVSPAKFGQTSYLMSK